jgi:hypothetical protein
VEVAFDSSHVADEQRGADPRPEDVVQVDVAAASRDVGRGLVRGRREGPPGARAHEPVDDGDVRTVPGRLV